MYVFIYYMYNFYYLYKHTKDVNTPINRQKTLNPLLRLAYSVGVSLPHLRPFGRFFAPESVNSINIRCLIVKNNCINIDCLCTIMFIF